jgi:aspartyl-tRNA(Asn)/glutamyl-tRNA(Gln) amidotransferase subunit C
MADKIDRMQVRKVAKLARLQLTDAEVDEFTGQLGAILEYVQQINKLDTQGIEPLAHCLPVSNVLREDGVTPSLGTEKTLENAPQRNEMFFIVPRILDENGGA